MRRMYKHMDVDKPKCSIEFSGDKLTLDSAKDECDINKIIGTALRLTGQLPPAPQAQYVDLSEIQGLDTFDIIEKGREFMNTFYNLPSDVRNAFNNDPKIYLKELFNPMRREEFEKLGIFKPQPKKDPEPEVQA